MKECFACLQMFEGDRDYCSSCALLVRVCRDASVVNMTRLRRIINRELEDRELTT